MDKANDIIYDFSNLTANEVEIETSDNTSQSTKEIAKRKAKLPFFESSDYSNGALYDDKNYCWSQTISEIGT